MQIIEINSLKQAQAEMQAIGCDPSGVLIMGKKAISKAIKINNLSIPAALILKQEMLSLGGDAVNARGTITRQVETTDVLLLGTLAHYQKLSSKLQAQDFGLAKLGQALEQALKNYQQTPPAISLSSGKALSFERAILMGILNCTPDSFSDGGQFIDTEKAVIHALQMIKEGAEIIDVGGESSRPGAKPVTPDEELERVVSVIEKIAASAIVSIDTTKAIVAKKALKAGAQIINDISALRGDGLMAEVAAAASCPIVLMHMQGAPQTMQVAPAYEDIMVELLSFFEERISFAVSAGIAEKNIILDPGIGFGKTTEHNLTILNRLEQLQVFGRPIMLGTSRKSVIGNVLNLPPENRLEGTAATVCFGIFKNAKIIRVHDVIEMARVVRMTEAIMQPHPPPPSTS